MGAAIHLNEGGGMAAMGEGKYQALPQRNLGDDVLKRESLGTDEHGNIKEGEFERLRQQGFLKDNDQIAIHGGKDGKGPEVVRMIRPEEHAEAFKDSNVKKWGHMSANMIHSVGQAIANNPKMAAALLGTAVLGLGLEIHKKHMEGETFF